MGVITIFGAAGYVGSALASYLESNGRKVVRITRENLAEIPNDLGHVVYAIGLTSDFRSRTFETVDAHVLVLSNLLKQKRFESFTYLSSTRVYRSSQSTDEHAQLIVDPRDPNDVYTLSKLLGEAIVLHAHPDKGRVCRLSNVYGGRDRSQNFLTSVISSARMQGAVEIRQSYKSAKDYIHINDACCAIEAVALHGVDPIYNVAAGENTSHRQLARALASAGVKVSFGDEEPVIFEQIRIDRLKNLISWMPKRLIEQVPGLLSMSS